MATVVNITNPFTGAVEQVDKLDHTAQQIDDAVALAPQLSNPNLLDNWYFGNPVNQRGSTEYNTGVPAIYTIDRWLSRNADGSVVVEEDGVRVTCASTDYNLFFEQRIEPTADDVPVYASALVTEVTGTVYMQLAYTDGTFSPSGGALKAGLKEIQCTKPVNRVVFQINKNGGSVKIKSVKLEYGNRQTLAHQDTNGNWVLNEIPDYGEQLARCQRYCQVFNYQDFSAFTHAYESNAVYVAIPLPVALRTAPTINDPTKFAVVTGGYTSENVPVTSVSSVGTVNCYLTFFAFVEGGLTANNNYPLKINGTVVVSADL